MELLYQKLCEMYTKKAKKVYFLANIIYFSNYLEPVGSEELHILLNIDCY